MGGSSPCASCKLLRRRCAKDCIFAPYFPSDDPHKFAIVHKVFGASNVSKMLQVPPLSLICVCDLYYACRKTAKHVVCAVFNINDDPLNDEVIVILQEIPFHQRVDAVSSLVYEANARVRDPVYGCVGAISYLQNQVSQLQIQLAATQAEMNCIQMQQEPTLPTQLDQDEKALLLASSNNFNNIPQYFNFASSSNVIQDPLKRESLWT